MKYIVTLFYAIFSRGYSMEIREIGDQVLEMTNGRLTLVDKRR